MDAHGRSAWAGGCLFVAMALASAPVAVCQPCPAGTRLTRFTATPSTITSGDSFTLAWRAPCGSVSLWRLPSGFRIPAGRECFIPKPPLGIRPPALFDTHPPLTRPPVPFAKKLAASGSHELRSGNTGYPQATGESVYAAVLWSGTAAHPAYCARLTTVTMNAPGCTSNNACDDHNPCTSDACVNGQCQHPNLSNGTACPDDGNPCTSDACVNGQCQHAAVPNGTACPTDGNPCTSDACVNGQCQHGPEYAGTWCAGTCGVCDGAGRCSADVGGTGDVGRCPGDVSCQTCDGRECHTKEDGATCADDGNVCTIDSCSAGACQHDLMDPCG